MKNKSKQVVLALGETTHTHLLTCEEEVQWQENEKDNSQIDFLLSGTSVVRHEEHAPIVLEPGKYKSYHQQEFDYFSQSNRAVFD